MKVLNQNDNINGSYMRAKLKSTMELNSNPRVGAMPYGKPCQRNNKLTGEEQTQKKYFDRNDFMGHDYRDMLNKVQNDLI